GQGGPRNGRRQDGGPKSPPGAAPGKPAGAPAHPTKTKGLGHNESHSRIARDLGSGLERALNIFKRSVVDESTYRPAVFRALGNCATAPLTRTQEADPIKQLFVICEGVMASVRKRTWIGPSGEAKTAWVVDYTDNQGDRQRKHFAPKKA